MSKTRLVIGALTLLMNSLAFAQTGQPSPTLAAFDQVMQGILAKYGVAGGALAVSHNGVLVYARGFGMADTASSTPVQPDSLFRVGSVSKTFTAIAVMKLVEQGKLQLSQPAFSLLPGLTTINGAKLNPQLADVTVQDLLNMTGGWDRGIITDPVDNTIQIASVTGLPDPLGCPDVIQYMLGRPVQHAPGSTYVYSNFGYCILGEIVEQASGVHYEDFVYQNVLQPLGIGRAKQAEPFLSDKTNGEVTYYGAPGAPLLPNAYNPGGPLVPAQYGNHDFLATPASGGWVTTPIDLLRFVNGIDGRRGGPLLQPATIQLMETKAPAFGNANSFYGLGFEMASIGNQLYDWNKDGALAGTSAYLWRGDGPEKVCWAVAFNGNPSDATEDTAGGFEGDYVNQIQVAINQVKTWPTTDQFPNYASTLIKPQLAVSGTPVQNAASFLPEITPGSWVSLYGANLATASRMWYPAEFTGNQLPLHVDNVSVTVAGQPAPVYYVSPGQLNIQAPANLTAGPAAVVVTHDGQAGNTITAQVAAAGGGLFTYSAGGRTYAAATFTNGVALGDPSVLQGTVAAKPGDFVQLFGTGFGASQAGVIITTPAPLPTLPTVTIGGVATTVAYAGLVGAGLFQVNVQIPQSMAAGNQQILVTYAGVTSPAGIIIPIATQ